MYKLIFEDETSIEVPGGYKAMAIYLAMYDGKNPPKYLSLWFKNKYVPKSITKSWEAKLWAMPLKMILTYDEDGKTVRSAITVPKPFVTLRFEEEDLIIEYGDVVYADDAY